MGARRRRVFNSKIIKKITAGSEVSRPATRYHYVLEACNFGDGRVVFQGIP